MTVLASGTGGAGASVATCVGTGWRAAEDHVQPLAVNQLHDVIVQAVLFADAENGDDVGVVQAGGGLGLAVEALDVLDVEDARHGQHLDGYAAAQRDLFRLVDDAHAAAADLADDAIIAETFRRLAQFAERAEHAGRRVGIVGRRGLRAGRGPDFRLHHVADSGTPTARARTGDGRCPTIIPRNRRGRMGNLRKIRGLCYRACLLK
jgi:hypothetical protein